jgi:hypothetical protein
VSLQISGSLWNVFVHPNKYRTTVIQKLQVITFPVPLVELKNPVLYISQQHGPAENKNQDKKKNRLNIGRANDNHGMTHECKYDLSYRAPTTPSV